MLMSDQFGGDLYHVTIGDNNAGAASVTLLLTAFGGRDDDLFHVSAAESQYLATVLTADETQQTSDSISTIILSFALDACGNQP